MSFLRRTCGPVPFMRVPGRLLLGPWALARFTSARRIAGLQCRSERTEGTARPENAKYLETLTFEVLPGWHIEC
jgi:hypothetical protein